MSNISGYWLQNNAGADYGGALQTAITNLTSSTTPASYCAKDTSKTSGLPGQAKNNQKL